MVVGFEISVKLQQGRLIHLPLTPSLGQKPLATIVKQKLNSIPGIDLRNVVVRTPAEPHRRVSNYPVPSSSLIGVIDTNGTQRQDVVVLVTRTNKLVTVHS